MVEDFLQYTRAMRDDLRARSNGVHDALECVQPPLDAMRLLHSTELVL